MDEVARFFSGSIPANLVCNVEHSNPFPALSPQLVILGQKAHSEETISTNGIQKPLLVVVKNSPFHFNIGVTAGGPNKIDFNQVAFEAFLLYDCKDLKEVDYVKVKPMEFRPNPTENGQQLDVELRIKVLSSQHEDMFFKVRLQGYNPLTREPIAGLTLLTPSIKVISKPEGLKKRQPTRKRTLTDMLVETVSRIEQKQNDQQQLIERMLKQQAEQMSSIEKRQRTNSVELWEALPEMQVPLSAEKQKAIAAAATTTTVTTAVPDEKEKPGSAFEDSFAALIRAYNKMQPEEKPETIRKLIRNSSTRDTERLSELLDLFWTEGLQKEPSFGSRPNKERPSVLGSKEDGCTCLECPHKSELERIDEFYKEFLSGGVNVPGF